MSYINSQCWPLSLLAHTQTLLLCAPQIKKELKIKTRWSKKKGPGGHLSKSPDQTL